MISQFYRKYSKAILWGVALSFPVFAYQAEQIPSNNDIETWLPRNTDVRQTYEDFKLDFGAEEVILVGVPKTSATPVELEALAGRLERAPEIRQVWTPDRMVARMQQMSVPEEEGRQRLEGLLQSADGSMSGVMMLLSETGLANRAGTVASVRQILEYCQLDGAEVALTGAPVIVTELDLLGSSKSSKGFFMITLAVSLGLLYFSLRHIGLSLSVLGITVWGIFANQTVLAWCGGEMNFILGSLSVMVMIFTLSIAVHLISYYSEAVRENAADPLQQALRESAWPCALSTLTTLLGLISLNVSNILPVAQFGYAAAMGSVVALVVGMGIVPALLVVWPQATVTSNQFRVNFYNWGSWIGSHRLRILGAATVVMAVTALGILQLRSDIDPVEFLPKNSRILSDLRSIERDLTNVDSIEVVVDFEGRKLPFGDQLERVRGIEARIAAHPGVRHTLSAATFFPTHGPEGAFAAARMLSAAQTYSGDDGLTANDHNLWRISARIQKQADMSAVTVLEQLTSELEGEPVTLTGITPLLKSAQFEIFDGFWQSFTAACLTIFIVMILALRSFVSAVIAMVPNILPIWLVFGGVGFWGLPVDIGMMMTGSISLGISVDCTFHFLVHYQQAYRQGHSSVEACRRALQHSGEPMLDSTLICSVGMMALCLSSFSPTARFGWLMTAQMLASLLGELLLLPALLCLRPERRSLSVRAASPPPPSPTPTPDPEPEIHRMPVPHIAQPGIRRRAARQ